MSSTSLRTVKFQSNEMNEHGKPAHLTVFPEKGMTPPSKEKLHKESIKGMALIALGIAIVAATVFITLLLLGIPQSQMSIATLTTESHSLYYTVAGAGGIIISLIGIFTIYKGTRYLKKVDHEKKLILRANELNDLKVTCALEDPHQRIQKMEESERRNFHNTLTRWSEEATLKSRYLIAKLAESHPKPEEQK